MEPLRGYPSPSPDWESTTYPLKSVPSSAAASHRESIISHRESIFYTPRAHKARGRWRWKLRNFASNFWLWDISACLLSLGISGVIGWQLMRLDGNPLSTWEYRLSPTSTLAFAVTIAKAAMMIPISSALGQLKWHWFRQTRKLDGMEHFDEASRGVLGSIRLLFRIRFWRLASIGAFITVCTIAIDAVTQNAVEVKNKPRRTYGTIDSEIAWTNTYNVSSSFPQRKRNFPPSDMLSAIYYAITTIGAPDLTQALFWCASGNCEYGTYDSLGVAHKCVQSNYIKNGTFIRHPALVDDWFYINTNEGIISANTTLKQPDSSDSSDFNGVGPLIGRWLVLANPSTIEPQPVAMDCAFYWAVNTYSSHVVNGTFRETILDTWTDDTVKTMPNQEDNILLEQDTCWRTNKTVHRDDPGYDGNCTNTIYAFAQESLQRWFSLSDFGLTGNGMNATEPTDTSLVWDYGSIFMQALMANVTNANETEIVDRIEGTAEKLAVAITAQLRQKPWYIDDSTGIGYYHRSNGTTIWQPVVFYHIQWQYLYFPLALVGLSVLFFLATLAFTAGEGGWKSSQLAVLFHGLSEKDAKAVGDVRDYADMMELGKDMQVRLVETETGRKLVSRESMMGM